MEHQAHPEDVLTGPMGALDPPPGPGGDDQGAVVATIWAGPNSSTGDRCSELKALLPHAFDTITKDPQLSRIMVLTERQSIRGDWTGLLRVVA